VKNLKYIDLNDEKMVTTINLTINIPLNKTKLADEFKKHYESNPKNIEAIFSYGFFNFLLEANKKDANINAERIKIALNCYNEAISIQPNYWMIYMFKGFLLRELPEIMQDSAGFLQTMEKMFILQGSSKTNFNYFLVPYIMTADYYLTINDKLSANKYIEKALKLNNIEKVQFKCLNEYFKAVIVSFKKRLLHSQDMCMANIIMDFYEKFINFV